jgi:cytochrome c2
MPPNFVRLDTTLPDVARLVTAMVLDRFIAKPDEIVPGNNMKPYGGLTSAEDRAKVIVFLESLTTN